MNAEPIRNRAPRPATVENIASDIRRLTAVLRARRAAAPDNVVELAALSMDLQRASASWRRLVPTGIWADIHADTAAARVPPAPARRAHTQHQ